ncbi:hypothetical protein SLEP1_g23205 [Rubroshorea leprosula]|uniref:Protein BIG GRAIN 1-like A n=1 Tax=Rubroshorea leprosula TaxID=152421 RepID=A0AAV5JKU8_9ROSI|nr:hypothetical protein SLEP1_g23205 [Rubroshorea leprosula]
MYPRERSLHQKESTFVSPVPQRRRTPSFSSSLLDAIYRSIDESDGAVHESVPCHYRETTMMKKQSVSSRREEQKVSSLGRAIMIENWMEKQKSSRGSSSSSDSSSGVVFSSSEAESEKPRRRAAPVRPNRCLLFDRRETKFDGKQQKPQREGGLTKTKLKAMKIYGELKKVKQPISPGGRITSFLNSIFNSNAKKVKMCSVGAMDDVNFERKSKSACSSAASLSRSCLSKSPSSRGNRKKRSVRFYPVSVIVDEESRPCGHKCINEQDPSLMPRRSVHQKTVKTSTRKDEPKNFVMEKESVYQRHYQKKSTREFHYRCNDEDEEDDDASCSSSDLFELDHLIGIGRYRDELPVYETTNFRTNQAIANGFMF